MSKKDPKKTLHSVNSQPMLPLPAQTGKVDKLFTLPTSPASQLNMDILSYRDDKMLIEYRTRKNKLSNSATYDVGTALNNARSIKVETSNHTITVQLENINKLQVSGKQAKKLYIFALMKANQKALQNGQLIKAQIDFPLQELLDIGLYKHLPTARKCFKSGADVLTSLKLKGTITKGQNQIVVDTLQVLFTGRDIKNNECTLYLNPNLNWQILASYFTMLPMWYFALPVKASDLLQYIFFLARQNIDKLIKKGYFDISFRAIQQKLTLPSEDNNKDPQKTIKDPLYQAIEDIENKYNDYNKEHQIQTEEPELAFLVMHDNLPIDQKAEPRDSIKKLNITQFLDHCHLRVYLKGAYLQQFLDIYKNKNKQIQASKQTKTKKATNK